ncbi:MAG: hypothetical protein HY819_12900 [Acidobacteria bacterium]|nr:hypothetical protein [Acidobacteriota bacterium]
MQSVPKLTQIANSIKLSKDLWKEKIFHSWQLGHQAGRGFAIGDDYDLPSIALTKEGFELIAEIDGISIGTNWITSIVVVTLYYGPWAVDITEDLVKGNYATFRKLNLFNLTT